MFFQSYRIKVETGDNPPMNFRQILELLMPLEFGESELDVWGFNLCHVGSLGNTVDPKNGKISLKLYADTRCFDKLSKHLNDNYEVEFMHDYEEIGVVRNIHIDPTFIVSNGPTKTFTWSG